MKEFARIMASSPSQRVRTNLERVLNSEVAISTAAVQPDFLQMYKQLNNEVDPQLFAQPRFQFLPAGVKYSTVEGYRQMLTQQDKVREALYLLSKSTEDPDVFATLTKSFG